MHVGHPTFFLGPAVAPHFFNSEIATGYGYLLNLKAALPHPLLIKIVASYRYRSFCCTLKKLLGCFTDVGSILKNLTL